MEDVVSLLKFLTGETIGLLTLLRYVRSDSDDDYQLTQIM